MTSYWKDGDGTTSQQQIFFPARHTWWSGCALNGLQSFHCCSFKQILRTNWSTAEGSPLSFSLKPTWELCTLVLTLTFYHLKKLKNISFKFLHFCIQTLSTCTLLSTWSYAMWEKKQKNNSPRVTHCFPLFHCSCVLLLMLWCLCWGGVVSGLSVCVCVCVCVCEKELLWYTQKSRLRRGWTKRSRCTTG